MKKREVAISELKIEIQNNDLCVRLIKTNLLQLNILFGFQFAICKCDIFDDTSSFF